MKLHKYCKRAHAEKMVNEGLVRIGTLHEYRSDERYNEEIADVQEGKIVHALDAKQSMEIDLLNGADAATTFARSVFPEWNSFPAGSSIKIVLEPNSGLEHIFDFPDQYMYCATTTMDFDMMKAFGYDTCLEIIDATAFFSLIMSSMPNITGRYCAKPVTYSDKRIRFDLQHADHPAYLKPNSYARQHEFRVIWEPVNRPIAPLVLSVPGVGQYCRIVAPHSQ